ncbi:hypothetical protein B566_EDAN005118 [Ephemera danica]|nr:hypothetical protein B566_EDAN005118 [Ephemera danica]
MKSSSLAPTYGSSDQQRKSSIRTVLPPAVPPRNIVLAPTTAPPSTTAADSNVPAAPTSTVATTTTTSSAGSSQAPPSGPEVKYPFGIQNDLGQVILSSGAKTMAEHHELQRQHHHHHHGHHSHGSSTPHYHLLQQAPSSPTTSPPLTPGPPTRPPSRRDLSPSRLSLQSASLQCSLASSATDLSVEAAQLERAIRTNDTLRVKRFLELHHDKFQVNLHGSILDKSSSETQSQDVEILLRKSKTLIDRYCIALRLDAGADEREPEVPAIFSNALHVAVYYGATDVVRLLLKYGLEPDQQGARPTCEGGIGSFFGGGSARLSGSSHHRNTPDHNNSSPYSSNNNKKRKAQISKSLPRQRSFSLDSEVDISNTQRFLNERRSVTLKSTPNISTSQQQQLILNQQQTHPPPSIPSSPENDHLLRPAERSLRRSSISPVESGGVNLDLAGLLAAHEQRRLAAYQHDSLSGSSRQNHDTSYSSETSASNDEADDSSDSDDPHNISPSQHQLDTHEESTSNGQGSLLRLNPLLTTCIKGHASLVSFLLKYGASVNAQDGYGNSPLHLCLCQANIPWECVLDLLEHGGQISLKNRSGLTPYDLAPSSLAKLQNQMLLDCWSAFRASPAPTPGNVPQQVESPPQNAMTDISPQQGLVAALQSQQSSASQGQGKPQGILRRLHEGLKARTDSEEVSSASVEVLPGISSAGSVKSKGSNPDIPNTSNKDNQDAMSKQDSRKKARRKAWKEKQGQSFQGGQSY